MLPDLPALLADLTLFQDPAFLFAFLLLARAHLRGPTAVTLASVVLTVLMAAAFARLVPLARDALAAERESGAAVAAARELAAQLWRAGVAPVTEEEPGVPAPSPQAPGPGQEPARAWR
jgi:hypothetical protein